MPLETTKKEWKSISAITPRALYRNIQLLLKDGFGYIGSEEIFSSPHSYPKEVKHYFFSNDRVIVTIPVHDCRKDRQTVSSSHKGSGDGDWEYVELSYNNKEVPVELPHLSDVLLKLGECGGIWDIACIPIAQSNLYGGPLALERKHFTLLVINDTYPRDQEKIFTHYDSKGLESKLYPLDTIRNCIEKFRPHVRENKLYTSYLGVQKGSDHSSCGYFVLSFIYHLVTTKDYNLEKFPKDQVSAYKKIEEIRSEIGLLSSQKVNTEEKDREKFVDLSDALTGASYKQEGIASVNSNVLTSSLSASVMDPYQDSNASAAMGYNNLDQVKEMVPEPINISTTQAL